ncbi:MAG: DsbC family protein [Gammaproteobacteria bacterium]|nr:DsbC family protein [Gammaproteobacteria bacterium]
MFLSTVRFIYRIGLGLLCNLPLLTHAETSEESRIKAAIEPRMGSNIKIDAVSKTPYAGLYEIQTNGEIFYTDEQAKYIFVGKIIDAQTYKDLTRSRVDQLEAIHFADLPLNDAIKIIKGNGKRVMATFEDPNCPYCKKMHQTLQHIDNVTIYTFLLPILSDDSMVKSKNIWCAADRGKVWQDWMDHDVPAPPAPDCKTPLERNLALGKKLRMAGTPTIYFSDGTRTGSEFDQHALEQKLSSLK